MIVTCFDYLQFYHFVLSISYNFSQHLFTEFKGMGFRFIEKKLSLSRSVTNVTHVTSQSVDSSQINNKESNVDSNCFESSKTHASLELLKIPFVNVDKL